MGFWDLLAYYNLLREEKGYIMLLVRIEHEPQFVMYLSIFVVQLLNCVRLFVTSWAAARQAS